MAFLFGPSFLILLPAIFLAAYAQWKVRSTYAKYANVNALTRTTARQAAERILTGEMIDDVTIESSQRRLSDHYDPKRKALRLSAPDSSSIAAIGVAAHEAGHAIQHARRYGPLSLRTNIVPIATFGSQLAFPLFFIGLFARMQPLVTAGIIAFSAAVLFTLITLPVEFDASRRAIATLRETAIVNEEELASVKEVLYAAALTYVAAAAMAALQLLMLLSVSRRR
ncbi:zinc metallopeptidase [Candidatus Bipolaricaulota bacterium]